MPRARPSSSNLCFLSRRDKIVQNYTRIHLKLVSGKPEKRKQFLIEKPFINNHLSNWKMWAVFHKAFARSSFDCYIKKGSLVRCNLEWSSCSIMKWYIEAKKRKKAWMSVIFVATEKNLFFACNLLS